MKFLTLSFLFLFSVLSAQGAELKVDIHTTPEGIEYGTWGEASKDPAPILIVLSGTIESTLGSKYFRQSGNDLSALGYLLVSVDIPNHGKQGGDKKPNGLSGWADSAGKGVNFIKEFNSRLSKVVDHLIETKIADPVRLAICGTSRGGFLSIHYMASDPRVKCAAAFAPVTDPAALNEFTNVKDAPMVKQLNLINQSDKLAGRPVWIVIGDPDARVSTRAAIDTAQKITAASIAKGLDSKVEIRIMPEPRGHSTPVGSAEAAAIWIDQHINGVAPIKVVKEKDQMGPRHILFVDDSDVLYRSGTKRILHPAKLNPTNPVVKEDKAWEMAIGWNSILRHPKTGKYQLWYQAYAGGRDERKTHKCVVCLAESDDGITFTKPELGLHDFDGSRLDQGILKNTNIVLLGNNGYGDRYANSVLYDVNAIDNEERYKMLYTDFSKDETGQEWPAFHAAFSHDGIHWKNYEENPLNHYSYGGRGQQPPFADEDVYSEMWDKNKKFTRKSWPMPLTMSDAVDVFWDTKHEAYVVYGKSWIQGPAGGHAWKHAMARVESKDFLNWSKPQIVSWPDDLDPPNTEYHTSPVFLYKGCYFSLNQILSARGEVSGAKADAMHIELMTSRDGIQWNRPFRETPFIDNTKQVFSNGAVLTNSTPIVLDKEIRFYYGGYNSGAIGGGKKLTDASQQSGVGFASIALDRFAGIRPLERSAQSTLKTPLNNIGQITLKPIDLTDVQEISVNADASGGTVRLEILNEEGYRLRGFSKDDAVPLAGDSLTQSATWNEAKLKDLPTGKYLLRIHLDNAEVFALTIK